ncbi:hypothetical protein BASA83_012791 [Batrachochytrium salamandrivorans]|nr:hypothetical protein BASA83_012791 [Batrachochytrium salamandrivorans]
MASLEDIVASLTDRLRSLELENQALQQGTRPETLSWYNPYIEQPERYAYDLSSWSAFKARMKATFGEINQEQWIKLRNQGSFSTLRITGYRWLPPWIKLFVLITGFLSGDRSSSITLANSDETNLQIHPFLAATLSKYQQRFVDNYSRSPANQPSAPITSTPVQQHQTTDDMDIDFATSWSSHFFRKTTEV